MSKGVRVNTVLRLWMLYVLELVHVLTIFYRHPFSWSNHWPFLCLFLTRTWNGQVTTKKDWMTKSTLSHKRQAMDLHRIVNSLTWICMQPRRTTPAEYEQKHGDGDLLTGSFRSSFRIWWDACRKKNESKSSCRSKASRKPNAISNVKYSNGTIAVTILSFWPRKCAWSWWKWLISLGKTSSLLLDGHDRFLFVVVADLCVRRWTSLMLPKWSRNVAQNWTK